MTLADIRKTTDASEHGEGRELDLGSTGAWSQRTGNGDEVW